ncbi:MAG: hypothetical protein MJA29_08685 [Candidatus Omnitrophica bacterium]|nr:hypothetical protein [Candidatus Omnitrophota bacterium]
MKKIFLLLAISFISIGVAFSEVDSRKDEVKTTVTGFFAALIEKNIEKEEIYINWRNFDWGGGPIGMLLKAGYKNESEQEQAKIRTNFLNGYNEALVTSRENKLQRNLTLDDFTIISIDIDIDNKAVVAYNAPFLENKKIYLELVNSTWLIYKIDRADPVPEG